MKQKTEIWDGFALISTKTYRYTLQRLIHYLNKWISELWLFMCLKFQAKIEDDFADVEKSEKNIVICEELNYYF